MPVVPFRPPVPAPAPPPDPTFLAISAAQMRQETFQRESASHLSEANSTMNLNPQEQALYKRHLMNLYGQGGVDNPDGSRSTLYNTTVNIEGKETIIPRVWDGKIVSVDEAVSRARREGISNFPSYNSIDEAESRYSRLHDFMEKDTADYLKSKVR